MAICTLIGWWYGARLPLAIAWTVLAIWMLVRPGNPGGYDAIARGWALLLAASFGVVSLVVQSQRFFPRALTSIALATAIAGLILLVRPNGATRFGGLFEQELRRRGNEATEEWTATTSTPDWRKLEEANPAVTELSAQVQQVYRDVPPITSRLVPALIALESLAGLALAWGLYHRVSRVRLGPPLGALREFRFNDQLIWGLVAGITFVALPTLSPLRGVGFNLLLFFGVLYALRGLGVLTWFLAPRRVALALLIIVAVITWPIIGVFSLGLGLGDTWLDWRGRARPTS